MNTERDRSICSWNDVSKYRGELFGIAIISVIVLHYFSGITASGSNRIVYYFARFYNGAVGSVGVDIFVFLSGFGLFFSLTGGKTLRVFYEKRIQRVLFPYLVWGFVFWIVKDFIILKRSFAHFLYDFSLLSFWGSGVQTFWYVAFICILYLIAPLLMKLLDRPYKVIAGVVFACCISIASFLLFPEFFSHAEIAIQRLPSFLLGMYCGKLSQGETGVSKTLYIILLFSIPIKIVLGVMDHPLARLFNGYYAVWIIVTYCLLRNRMRRAQSPVFSFLTFVGKYSLELYIVHIAIRNLMGTLKFDLRDPLIYLLHVCAVIPLAFVFAQLQKVKLFREK